MRENACGRRMAYLFINHYFLRFRKLREDTYSTVHSLNTQLLSTY